MENKQKLILIAVIGAPHGIKGAVRIKSFSDDPLALAHYQPLYDESGRPFKILSLNVHKRGLVAQIAGVKNRDEAQLLQGVQLFIDRQSLDDDLDQDEFYQADLLGFRAVALEGEIIGNISGFFNFGAGDLVEISDESGKSWLIPFSCAAVPVIDENNRQIKIDRQAAGLIEQKEGEKKS